jgi:hypothetical protein
MHYDMRFTYLLHSDLGMHQALDFEYGLGYW